MNLAEGLSKIITTIVVAGMGFGVAVSLSMRFEGTLSLMVLMSIMMVTILVLFERWGLNILSNSQ